MSPPASDTGGIDKALPSGPGHGRGAPEPPRAGAPRAAGTAPEPEPAADGLQHPHPSILIPASPSPHPHPRTPSPHPYASSPIPASPFPHPHSRIPIPASPFPHSWSPHPYPRIPASAQLDLAAGRTPASASLHPHSRTPNPDPCSCIPHLCSRTPHPCTQTRTPQPERCAAPVPAHSPRQVRQSPECELSASVPFRDASSLEASMMYQKSVAMATTRKMKLESPTRATKRESAPKLTLMVPPRPPRLARPAAAQVARPEPRPDCSAPRGRTGHPSAPQRPRCPRRQPRPRAPPARVCGASAEPLLSVGRASPKGQRAKNTGVGTPIAPATSGRAHLGGDKAPAFRTPLSVRGGRSRCRGLGSRDRGGVPAAFLIYLQEIPSSSVPSRCRPQKGSSNLI